MDCMIKGINETMAADPQDVLDRANLGYCQLFKFKCAATRTVMHGCMEDLLETKVEKRNRK